LVLLGVLITQALLGALLPPAFGLSVITIGMLTIFVVFRHWSRDEDEALADLKLEEKDIKIRGDVSFEVRAACSFILIFAPIAFAQIAEAGYGFRVRADAPPFAFFLYSLIELLKAGTMVDYYDLFSGQLPFDRISDVRHEGAWAKGAVLAYRLSINLLLLAVITRLLNIARRRAQHEDLRDFAIMLASPDGKTQLEAVNRLKALAFEGRVNARRFLQRIDAPKLEFDAQMAVYQALMDLANDPRFRGNW
jgi:hypothetical protein